MSDEKEHPLLAVSGILSSIHGCEVCLKSYADSELIAVEGIEYLRWERLSPWYICYDCAKKICDALNEKEGKRE